MVRALYYIGALTVILLILITVALLLVIGVSMIINFIEEIDEERKKNGKKPIFHK